MKIHQIDELAALDALPERTTDAAKDAYFAIDKHNWLADRVEHLERRCVVIDRAEADLAHLKAAARAMCCAVRGGVDEATELHIKHILRLTGGELTA